MPLLHHDLGTPVTAPAAGAAGDGAAVRRAAGMTERRADGQPPTTPPVSLGRDRSRRDTSADDELGAEGLDWATQHGITAQCAPEPSPVQVLLREDHQIYLAGLRTLLESEPGFVVVGELDSLASAATLGDGELAAVVIVVRQGLLVGPELEALTDLSARGAAVLVLAESDSERELRQALRAGARGYLSRRMTAWQLLDGIRALAHDEPAFDATTAAHLLRYLTDGAAAMEDPAPVTPLEKLTTRQRAVALLVADGLTNDEVARELHVSQTTVKSHLASVMRRLEVRSRTQLAVLVNRHQ